ncbi:MAG: hypothetical protein LAT67_04975 [Balneolales bacterium]|nr:hypothetical protein [Balneolales bacterium]
MPYHKSPVTTIRVNSELEHKVSTLRKKINEEEGRVVYTLNRLLSCYGSECRTIEEFEFVEKRMKDFTENIKAELKKKRSANHDG